MSDKEMVQSIQLHNDSVAWECLYTRYARSLFVLAYKMVHDMTRAEDLCSQVWVKVARKIHTFDESGGSLGAWLAAIARNQAIDNARAQSNMPTHLPLDVNVHDVSTTVSGSANGLECDDLADALSDFLRLRDDLDRATMHATVSGEQQSETAHRLGVSVASIRVRLHRMRHDLRKYLRNKGIEVA